MLLKCTPPICVLEPLCRCSTNRPEGVTEITGVEYIDRGYDNLVRI